MTHRLQRGKAGKGEELAGGLRIGLRLGAGQNIGVEWNPPPCPEYSWLYNWYLGSPVPFFPEVHEELMKSWKAPFTARANFTSSSTHTTLNGGTARGYTEVPRCATMVHLSLQNTTTSWYRLGLPYRNCKFILSLKAKAYCAVGQATSALHAMVILQTYQAKVLKRAQG